MKSCVLQGPALGPLLYLIYVDMMRFYLLGACLTSFAHDTALTFSSCCIESLIEEVSSVMAQLYIFTTLSLLSVNVSKTNSMVCSRVGTLIDLGEKNLLSGEPLNQVNCV